MIELHIEWLIYYTGVILTIGGSSQLVDINRKMLGFAGITLIDSIKIIGLSLFWPVFIIMRVLRDTLTWYLIRAQTRLQAVLKDEENS